MSPRYAAILVVRQFDPPVAPDGPSSVFTSTLQPGEDSAFIGKRGHVDSKLFCEADVALPFPFFEPSHICESVVRMMGGLFLTYDFHRILLVLYGDQIDRSLRSFSELFVVLDWLVVVNETT
jgi:hypothetical protein